MATFVLRVWLSDRPGALGAVASRIGSVGGDVTGIDILERGAGRAIDELAVELPDESLVALMVEEVRQVDGVAVESVTAVADALHDPRLDALETAAMLVGASTPREAIESLCEQATRTVGAEWAAVVSIEDDHVMATHGPAPEGGWLLAFVAGSRSAGGVAPSSEGQGLDVTWAPLPAAGLALVLGRDAMPFRARERRQTAALARIVDARFRDLTVLSARRAHPSMSTEPAC